MTKDKYKHAMEILEADAEGKTLQYRYGPTGTWKDYTQCEDEQLDGHELSTINDPNLFRIKREPRRVWVNISKEAPHQFIHLTPEEAKACAHPDWCSESAVEFVEVLK